MYSSRLQSYFKIVEVVLLGMAGTGWPNAISPKFRAAGNDRVCPCNATAPLGFKRKTPYIHQGGRRDGRYSIGSFFFREKIWCQVCDVDIVGCDFRGHVWRKHMDAPAAKCPHCNRLFNNSSNTSLHIRLNHGGVGSPVDLRHKEADKEKEWMKRCFGK